MAQEYNASANDTAKNNKSETWWQKLHSFIPSDMDTSEYTIWIVCIIVVIIVLCVLCFCLKKLLLFGIIIAVLVALAFWYVYIYRNQASEEDKASKSD